MSKLRDLLGKEVLFFDGGTGSVLQGMGLKPGELPELWNINKRDKIIDLHKQYFLSGANIVKTNTFGAFSNKFKSWDLKTIVKNGIENANIARKEVGLENLFVAFDIGPCGKLLKPMGDLDFEDAVTLFKETIEAGITEEIDAILIETMNDSYETKAAVIAAKELNEKYGKDVPILVTNVYDLTSHLLTGADPETMVCILEGLGVDALGLNCSLGPKDMIPSIERLIKASSIPVIVNPNAGLPREVDGKTVYDVGPEDFTATMKTIFEMGASVFGGCCGTNPTYIKCLHDALSNLKLKPIEYKNRTILSSYTHTVEIGNGAVPCLIGERINPTGKKKFKEALRAKDIPYIIRQGLDQEAAGCHVLDVNVGLPEIDEKEMMVKVMTELQGVTSLPLQLDTSSPEVMEAALRRYNGKPLVNSVNGKQVVMDAVFPLVKKYGGVVVGLTIDESGIPETTEGRVAIARKIYENADKWGIPRKDIIIDSLTMAISSDINAAKATLETIRIIRDEFGGSSVLGVSNISFGLPNREFVTSIFFTLAMHNGLGAAIMNPLSMEMMKAWHVFVLLKAQDKDCLGYINFSQKYDESKKKADDAMALKGVEGAISAIQNTYGLQGLPSVGQVKPVLQPKPSTQNTDSNEPVNGTLQYAVIHGLKDDSARLTQAMLKGGMEAVEVIDKHLIVGLDYVGKKFEKKQMYLPQLLMAADSAKAAFGVIKEYLESTGKKGEPKGTCIVATVHGDIHDIGKNIVKVLLENYDFNVIDLGKDVPPEVVVEACKKEHVGLVGLSALMTTTVPAMKATIELLRKECPWAKVCVGGAVMTQEYADSIGADFFGRDAMSTVSFAQKVFGVK